MPDTRTDQTVVAPPRPSDLGDAVRAHRAVVVRRLLSRQITAAAIDHILPGWSDYAVSST